MKANRPPTPLTSHSELSHGWRWGRGAAWAFVAAAVLLGGAIVVERYRGKRALTAWKREKAAQGEVFDVTQLWRLPSAQELAFSNELEAAQGRIPARLQQDAGRLAAMVEDESGTARRGSQEPRPVFVGTGTFTPNWADLEALVREAGPALRIMHELLAQPPSHRGSDLARNPDTDTIPGCWQVRQCAQTLHAAALVELHRGDLAAASSNLVSLFSCGRLYEDDPDLVLFMIRVAVAGLSVETCWDALQAEGWTEPQLEELQRACGSIQLLPKMARTMEHERAGRLHALKQFRRTSYFDWETRYRQFYRGFGVSISNYDAQVWVRSFRHYVSHPLWSVAWADSEELLYLKDMQLRMDALRATERHRSGIRLNQELMTLDREWHPPEGSWRYYFQLPLLETTSEIIGPEQAPPCPVPVIHRAYSVSMNNLTLHELALTAIALKRYSVRHGAPPETLQHLVPEFLKVLPCDYMTGEPLRYRLNTRGTYTLYSVGEDGRDDGGLTHPAPGSKRDRFPWNGPDLVWPIPASTTPSNAR